jgi:glycosyltransferase involved in cell wall biosynthesis
MIASLPRVCVITHSPSPYQVELFDAVARTGELALDVVYLCRRDPQRLWGAGTLAHDHAYDEEAQREKLAARAMAADLAVINYFKHPLADVVMQARAHKGTPWVFWGERPRRHALELLSRWYRSRRLRELHHSRAPIWGIGKMAVDAYRNEFGARRPYVNLPYFSDLKRFQVMDRGSRKEERVLLFSGSLIARKGVDMVAKVFARLAREGVQAKLKIMGDGVLEALLKNTLNDFADQVEFLGFQDWQALPAAYAGADILCVPSRYDGWGLVVPEGLAAGLPVIGTVQTGAASEFIKTESNGWLLPPGDEESLYAAMKDAATMTRERLAEMSHAAVAAVRTHQLDAGVARFIDAAKQAMTA